MIVIVGSVVCLLLFRNTIRQRELQAELYRQVYVEYQLKPKVRVVRHDITYEWKDGEMVLDSRMVLQNRNTESLSEIVLYLNPALKIYSMGEEGKKLSFHREQQLVVIERPLLPGDSVTLQRLIEERLTKPYATRIYLGKINKVRGSMNLVHV